jgi:hypothetical protein
MLGRGRTCWRSRYAAAWRDHHCVRGKGRSQTFRYLRFANITNELDHARSRVPVEGRTWHRGLIHVVELVAKPR